MTRKEHLLTILAEECDEVAVRVSKAKRFGPEEIQPGQPFTNGDRIYHEFAHVLAAYEMLHEECIVPPWAFTPDKGTRELMNAKRRAVEQFLIYSAERGTLTEPQ